jgi:hypothetical protein
MQPSNRTPHIVTVQAVQSVPTLTAHLHTQPTMWQTHLSLLLISGSRRRLPIIVFTQPKRAAYARVRACQSRTSGRSAYQRATVASASSREVPQSLARPCAVLPYAMEKLRI